MRDYHHQVHCPASGIDLDFWRAPQGVAVPDDELGFLLVPDAVEAMAVCELAQQVLHYQQAGDGAPITRALMATMGGLLPGILLHDHLANGRAPDTPEMVFGTIGVSLYEGPDQRRENPLVGQDISIPVAGEVVLLIDDLGDRGGTLQFLRQHVESRGARAVLTLVLYMKPLALRTCPVDFHFGEVAQETWIITPRERVETLVKRVPVWRERGADQRECRRRLVDIIGYPAPLADYYLARLFAGD